MNPLLRAAYEGFARAASAAAELAPAGESKLARTFRGRAGLLDRYRAFGRSARDTSRPLLWVHAPSVGEGLQARPVLERARLRHARWQLAYTHYSPSAESFAARLDVDFRDYLPFDTAAAAGAVLDALAPTALLFSKLDVWPSLVAECARRHVPVGMLSATLTAESGRGSLVGRALLGEAYAALGAVGAVSSEDAERLVLLGVRPGVIEVTGDVRYDQVAERASASDRSAPMLAALASTRPTLVAGSTWPSDERELLPALARLGADSPRTIIAPHEPTAAHLASIEVAARAAGLSVARLGAAGEGAADLVLVDRVGVLGDLYALAGVAYVGGGFHGAGLHSVLEPAAFGAPVLFGPRHHSSRDATLLIERGGGVSVTDATGLERQLREWLANPAARARAGAAAKQLVATGVGAADRSLALVERLMS
ncbi:MAG: Three-deoxy-D-manno-octulosonic-acid transferase protein [Gemmatimonadetes bacterium]|nr:Three-deoxy-D-manno-octulosonic-acid transferase protein [Gemmatimonadota bacterium]